MPKKWDKRLRNSRQGDRSDAREAEQDRQQAKVQPSVLSKEWKKWDKTLGNWFRIRIRSGTRQATNVPQGENEEISSSGMNTGIKGLRRQIWHILINEYFLCHKKPWSRSWSILDPDSATARIRVQKNAYIRIQIQWSRIQNTARRPARCSRSRAGSVAGQSPALRPAPKN